MKINSEIFSICFLTICELIIAACCLLISSSIINFDPLLAMWLPIIAGIVLGHASILILDIYQIIKHRSRASTGV